MTEVQELEQQSVGVDEEVENRQSAATADDEVSRQPEKSKVNLDEFDEFRQWKSQYDQRLAQMERDRRQAEQRYQAEAAYYRQQLEQVQTADLDDYGRLEHQLRREREEKQQYAARLQQLEVEQAKREALSDIADAFSVSVNDLMAAEDYRDAIRLAKEVSKQSERQRAAEAQAAADAKAKAKAERSAANRPDTGGPSAPPSGFEADFKKARTSKDLARFYYQQ